MLASGVRDFGDTVVLVADGQLLEAGLIDRLAADIRPDRVVPVPRGEPRVKPVAQIAATCAGADVVVAVGGGSTLDTAKLAAAVASSPHPLEDHLLSATRFTGSLPVVAIPTTAGSGAEVTRTAVVSRQGRKSWAWDDHLRPRAAVHDPALTMTLPLATTVASGVDAFVHAIEAATAQTRHPDANTVAAAAAGTIASALPTVVDQPDDVPARGSMLVAACAAGIGIDRCGVGIGHAIGHALGSLVTVTHGFAVMLGTIVAIEWSVSTSGDRYRPVAHALHPTATEKDVPELVRMLAQAVALEIHVATEAAAQPLDPSDLAQELVRPEHAPMLRNSAVSPGPDDIAWIAGETAARWNAAGGRG